MKLVFAILICLCLCAPFTVCAADTNSGTASVLPAATQDSSSVAEEQRSASEAAVIAGANAFAFRLSAALARQTGDKNLVCSPYSAWLPLAALINAADDPYKAELLAALNVAGISEQDVNQASQRVLSALTSDESRSEDYAPLKIANAIFVDHRDTLNSNFAQMFLEYYQGTAMSLDFNSSEAANTINQWASDHTEGLISHIMEDLDPNTVAVIANAIYFSGRWPGTFSRADTQEGVFHSPTGETRAFFMQNSSRSLYYEDTDVQAVSLAFHEGSSLHIILPKDGDAVGLLSSMTNSDFRRMDRNYKLTKGELLLPRFSIESEDMPLTDTLVALGVPLFDDKHPSLDGLYEASLPISFSSVSQKAMIKVDEEGATAAALTKATRTPRATRAPETPFKMICDKPFVFVLYGNTHGVDNQVLFTGIVNRP